jgi:hypothetical protein
VSVTARENVMKNPESGIFTCMGGKMSARSWALFLFHHLSNGKAIGSWVAYHWFKHPGW